MKKELKWILIWILAFTAGYCSAQVGEITKDVYYSVYYNNLDSVGHWAVVGTTQLTDNPTMSGGAPTWESSDLYLPPFDTGNWVLWDGKKYEYVNDGSVKLHEEVYSELRKMWITIFVSFAITYAFIGLILYNYRRK